MVKTLPRGWPEVLDRAQGRTRAKGIGWDDQNVASDIDKAFFIEMLGVRQSAELDVGEHLEFIRATHMHSHSWEKRHKEDDARSSLRRGKPDARTQGFDHPLSWDILTYPTNLNLDAS